MPPINPICIERLYTPLRQAQPPCRHALEPTDQARRRANHHSACASCCVSPDRTPQTGLQHCPAPQFNTPVPSAIVFGHLVCPGRHAPNMQCSPQSNHLTSFRLTTATRGCRSGSLRVCRRLPSLVLANPTRCRFCQPKCSLLEPYLVSLSCVFVSKSLASWRSCICRAGSPRRG
jgi:hypothetical protein